MTIHVGTAGWSLAHEHKPLFGEGASHLARYAGGLNTVEINSSFYRPHRRATYERWAASVPAAFCFAVKIPRAITHDARLKDSAAALDTFLEQVGGLGAKRGPLLVQLPPSLAFDVRIAGTFFKALRKRDEGLVACEPRHASWFEEDADVLLRGVHVARVAADPAPVETADRPGGWDGFRYWRWHGSPKIYYSDYPRARIAALAKRLRRGDWCIFDNTAAGAAIPNALAMRDLL